MRLITLDKAGKVWLTLVMATTCIECPPDEPGVFLGLCTVCDEPTCEWDGKEYHTYTFNGIAHHLCYALED